MYTNSRLIGGGWTIPVMLLFFLVQSGCKPGQIENITNSVRQATVDQIAPIAAEPLSGAIDLKFDAPIQTSQAFAKWLPIGDGRPSVILIRSYEDPTKESFPSVMIQGQTTATDVKSLAGKTVKATIFTATSSLSPVWHIPDGKQADLLISAVDDKSITCEISSTPLICTDGRTSTLTGTIKALFASTAVANQATSESRVERFQIALNELPRLKAEVHESLGTDRFGFFNGGNR